MSRCEYESVACPSASRFAESHRAYSTTQLSPTSPQWSLGVMLVPARMHAHCEVTHPLIGCTLDSHSGPPPVTARHSKPQSSEAAASCNPDYSHACRIICTLSVSHCTCRAHQSPHRRRSHRCFPITCPPYPLSEQSKMASTMAMASDDLLTTIATATEHDHYPTCMHMTAGTPCDL